MGAYYNNSLKARRKELSDDLRMAVARYDRLYRQGHPSTLDQGKWVDLLRRMIGLVDAEMKDEKVPAWDDARDGIF